MSDTLVNPDTAREILAEAAAKGMPVESYLKKIIDGASVAEDPRLIEMREAMSDELFLADLAEVMEDFRHIDLK